jgi:hypothetical protein
MSDKPETRNSKPEGFREAKSEGFREAKPETVLKFEFGICFGFRI